MNPYLDLYLTFARIGVCTFGGGYAMLPILQREVVENRHWATEDELMDYYAIGQCTPGIIAVNTATFVGQKTAGIAGGIIATLGVVFPSLIIITIIAAFIQNFSDLAIVQNDVMDYAYNGTDLFAEEGAATEFATVAGLYAEVCQVVSTGDIKSIADLKGKRVSVGDAGSGVEFNARQILEAYGISFNDIEVNNLGFGDSSDALKDGKIDAFFCTAGAPTTAIVELATTNSINLLEIDDEHAAALAEAHPFYTTYPIPGGSYKGVDEDVQTVAIKATLICSPKLSEETVYNLTKALFDNQSEIAAAHAKGEELSLEYAVSGISVPFHPGAEKYFKEVGAIK